MKAMVLTAINAPLELQDIPIPVPGPTDVLLRVKACGSGLTLHHAVKGYRPINLPAIIGHEILGEVVEVGSKVQGFAIGDYVTPHATVLCGHCRMCRTGREPLCEFAPGGVGRQIPGGYAEFVALPERICIKVPPQVVEQHGAAGASIICDAMTTPYKVTDLTSLGAGDYCVIYGAAGGVGIHLVQMAKLRGAHVIGIDIGQEKLAATIGQGADHVIDAASEDAVGRVHELTGGWGADVVVDFVGTNDTLNQGVSMLAKSGRLAIVGLSPKSDAVISAPASTLLYNGQSIFGSRSYSRQEVAECLALVASGACRPVVNHVYPLEKANDAHALVASGRNIGRVVLTMG